MPVTRLISVNGSAGAFVNITASIWARQAQIIEDEGAQVQQGLQYKQPSDSFAQQYTLSATFEPIILGNLVAAGGGKGSLLGGPARTDPSGNTISADTLIKLRSNSVTATQVRVLEME